MTLDPKVHESLIEKRNLASAEVEQARKDGDKDEEQVAIRRLDQAEKDLDAFHGSPSRRYSPD